MNIGNQTQKIELMMILKYYSLEVTTRLNLVFKVL